MIGDMLSKEKHDIVLLQEVGGTSSLEYLSSMYLLHLVKTFFFIFFRFGVRKIIFF